MEDRELLKGSLYYSGQTRANKAFIAFNRTIAMVFAAIYMLPVCTHTKNKRASKFESGPEATCIRATF